MARFASSARWAVAAFVSFLAVSSPAAGAAADGLETAFVARVTAAAEAACAEVAAQPAACAVSAVERRALSGDVAEYSFRLTVGNGPFEAIGLHRVVRERAPWLPEAADPGVYLVHGDAWDFRAAFFAGAAAPDAASMPVWLAERGVDVWGVDLRWTRVPAETTDLSFMAGWGFATEMADLDAGLAAARAARRVTGSGGGPLHLLGWSRGAQIGYAYLSHEAGKPAAERHVAGYVPVDVYLKTDDPALQAGACVRAAGTAALLAGGTFHDQTGALLNALGVLATVAPDGPSPILPGVTNRQAALLAGGASFLFFPPGLAPVPHYHLAAAAFDAFGLPVGLLYTPEARWIDSLRGTRPYEPLRLLFEADTMICDEVDLPFDDRLAAVEVPVLYVGAAGGFGATGLHTASLLTSAEVDSLIVSVVPPEAVLLDYGHADLFQAADAPQRVFQPLLDWLLAH